LSVILNLSKSYISSTNQTIARDAANAAEDAEIVTA